MLKLPTEIENEMKLFRAGFAGIPTSYINFHCVKANEDMYRQDWKILEDHGLVFDGWGDGFKAKQLVVAFKQFGEWRVATVKWHTSGAWFRQIEGCGGWFRFREMVTDV